jgi:uncharacterized protein YndB with AHSA1/START domain
LFDGSISLEVGGALALDDPGHGVSGTVTDVVPGETLSFTWSSQDAADSDASFVLADAPGGTLLRLTHTVRVGNVGALMAAWHYVLDDLAQLLETGDLTPTPGRFQQLTARYAGLETP